jgi:hypothetical protein
LFHLAMQCLLVGLLGALCSPAQRAHPQCHH